MQIKLMVITQVHETWPARPANGNTPARAAGESFNLVCQDMSQPAEQRMTENISYKLKEDEIPLYWDKSMDKIINAVCRRIVISKSGKASLVGEIVPEAKK
jgi:hypothetical protein